MEMGIAEELARHVLRLTKIALVKAGIKTHALGRFEREHAAYKQKIARRMVKLQARTRQRNQAGALRRRPLMKRWQKTK